MHSRRVADSLHAFSDNVRTVREELGMSQEALADAAGMHLTHVSKIERRKCEPGARTVAKIMRGLGISGGPLFEGIDGSGAET
jgi:transcriptional regulator with XRE-family HTH domain